MRKRFSVLGLAVAGSLLASAAIAQTNDIGLPSTLAWSAYGVGSGGYNQSVAIGNALKQKYGVNLRVLPGKTMFHARFPYAKARFSFQPTVWVAVTWLKKVSTTLVRHSGVLKPFVV